MRTTLMINMSENHFRAAVAQHDQIKRKAERLGPIQYELAQRRAQDGAGAVQRVRAFASQQFGVVRALLAMTFRIQRFAER